MFTIKGKDSEGNIKRTSRGATATDIEYNIFTPIELAKSCFKKSIPFVGEKHIDILDAFSGTGNLSFAASSIFKFDRCLMIENNCKFAENCMDKFSDNPLFRNIYCELIDIEYFIDNNKSKFDLILCNPPFRAQYMEDVLWKLHNILTDNGHILLFAPMYFLNNSDKRLKRISKHLKHVIMLSKMAFNRPLHTVFMIISKSEVEEFKSFCL